MHNTLSLLFLPLLLLYVLLALLILPDRKTAAGARIATALALGSGVAAFFLLPALIEKEFAQVERVIISPDFDFRFHFVSLGQLLAWLPAANTGLLNPTFPRTLGLVHAGLALVGLGAGGWQWLKQRRAVHLLTLTFSLMALLGAIFLMLPVSNQVWETIPLLAFVQFPHRLLAPASLALALLAGLAVDALPARAAFWLALGGISLLILSVASLFYPRYRSDVPPRPTISDMFTYERDTGAIGTTSFGEYLPIWVQQPPRESPLEAQFGQQRPVERLAVEYLPAGAVVESASYGLNQAQLTLTTPEPHLLIFNTFYFPGWQAWVDGSPASVRPFSERGLVAVGISAGRHQLHLAFVETPVRRVANAISLVSLLGITVLLLWSLAKSTSSRPAAPPPLFTRPQLTGLAGLALLLIAGKLLLLDQFSSPVKQVFDGATVRQAKTSTQVNFGDAVSLLGYTLPQSTVTPGNTFDLTAYWQAQTPLLTNYSVLAQLVDGENHLYAAQDNLHPGTIPTSTWPPWTFVQDEHRVAVPPGTPPGDYFLVVGLYNPVDWTRLPVVTGGQSGWPDVFAIPVTVEKTAQYPSLDELNIRWPVTVEVTDKLRLLGATPARDSLQPGDFLRAAIFWEALAAPLPDYQVSLRLLAANGETLAERTVKPSHNRYPTSFWTAGERIRDNHALWVPPAAPPGIYQLQLQLLDSDDQPVTDWLTLGDVVKE